MDRFIPPKPKSLLGYHRVLSPHASIKVSPLCLGAMNLGTAWGNFMGSVDKKASYELLDYFYGQGGNFIDTANNYQDEESETFIGDWMKERGNRDEMVIATKYTTSWRSYKKDGKVRSNFGGNNAKSMKHSVEASLKKLQTDYIDILYVHWWDHTTSIPEVMQYLNDLVVSGKVIYLGISDTPAWIVSKANEYARGHGLRTFVVYQGLWSAATRDFERDIIPMCRDEGMALAPWGALGGGAFKTKEQREKNEGRKTMPPSELQIKVSDALGKIADRKGTVMTSVALAYVMHKTGMVFPIVGGRTIKHLSDNIEALGLQLSQEDIDEIESVAPFDYGFPTSMLTGGKVGSRSGTARPIDIFLSSWMGHFDYLEEQLPIRNGLHSEELKAAKEG